jgi:hypothetical protein
MRRGLVLASVWLLGAGLAVALSFAAVGRVASGVSPADGATLSRRAIDNALTARVSPHPSRTSAGPSTTRPSPPRPTTTLPRSLPTAVPSRAPVIAPLAPQQIGGTVTTSRGGTVWTRCSGSSSIVYVAAIPKNGYQRSVDVEDASGIVQLFANGTSQSKVHAECTNGVVHAAVEEETADN